MAFIEPSGFSPPASPPSSGTARPSGRVSKRSTGSSRKAAKTGGVGRASPVKSKEKKMAKRKTTRRKRARTPAQIAATKKMLAANKSRSSNPATKKPRRRRKTAAKPIDVKKSPDGSVRVTTRAKRKLTPAAKQHVRQVRSQLAKTRGKRRSTTYRVGRTGRVGKVIRENPANRTKAIVSSAAGFGLGLVAADILDRFVATRKGDAASAPTGDHALAKIREKSDATRIFAQAAGAGLGAVGAYALRKKSVVGTYLLGGMAAAFVANGLRMIIVDHLMPKALPAAGENGWKGQLAYGLGGPKGYMPPFQGKSTVIGPQATGSVGGYNCTRVPVNPFQYRSDGRDACRPFPFESYSSKECIDTVNKRPPTVPSVPTPQVPRPPVTPQVPRPPVTPRTPRIPGVTPRTPSVPTPQIPFPEARIPPVSIPEYERQHRTPSDRRSEGVQENDWERPAMYADVDSPTIHAKYPQPIPLIRPRRQYQPDFVYGPSKYRIPGR